MEKKANISGIYAIIYKATEERYIGSAVNIRSRWECHKSNLRKNKHANKHLQRLWNLHNEDAFSFIVIEECPRELLLDHEQGYIDEKSELNILPVAGSRIGKKHSQETCKKISLARAGKPLSEEHKARISEGGKGRIVTPEARAKISERQRGANNHQFGKHHTEEHKAALRDANSGEKSPTYGRKHTEEEKRKMREAWRNRTVSRETIERLRTANTGKKHSPEARQRMSDAAKKRWVRIKSVE